MLGYMCYCAGVSTTQQVWSQILYLLFPFEFSLFYFHYPLTVLLRAIGFTLIQGKINVHFFAGSVEIGERGEREGFLEKDQKMRKRSEWRNIIHIADPNILGIRLWWWKWWWWPKNKRSASLYFVTRLVGSVELHLALAYNLLSHGIGHILWLNNIYILWLIYFLGCFLISTCMRHGGHMCVVLFAFTEKVFIPPLLRLRSFGRND